MSFEFALTHWYGLAVLLAYPSGEEREYFYFFKWFLPAVVALGGERGQQPVIETWTVEQFRVGFDPMNIRPLTLHCILWQDWSRNKKGVSDTPPEYKRFLTTLFQLLPFQGSKLKSQNLLEINRKL